MGKQHKRGVRKFSKLAKRPKIDIAGIVEYSTQANSATFIVVNYIATAYTRRIVVVVKRTCTSRIMLSFRENKSLAPNKYLGQPVKIGKSGGFSIRGVTIEKAFSCLSGV